MAFSKGYALVFLSSIKVCLKEIQEDIDEGKVSEEDLSATIAELKCMRSFLEKDKLT